MIVPLDIDGDGFLRNLADWNREIAIELAAKDDIELTPEHWEVILLARDYYEKFRISPATRVLVSLLKRAYGPDKGSSIYLMRLFTGTPAKVVSRTAGLPRPVNCD